MKHASPVLHALAAGLVFALAGTATASPVWSLDWGSGLQSVRITTPSGQSQLNVTFSNAHGSAPDTVATVATLTLQRNGPESFPSGTFRKNYALNLRLTDLTSGASEMLHFTGYLQATIAARRATITNVLTSPAGVNNIELGNNIYSFVLGPFTPPDLSGKLPGSLGVDVSYQAVPPPPPPPPPPTNTTTTDTTTTTTTTDVPPASGNAPPGGVASTPEPATAVLGALGFGLAGFFGWRRRQGA